MQTIMKSQGQFLVKRRELLLAILSAGFVCSGVSRGLADDDNEANEIPGHDEAGEHEYALDLVKSGEALPLAEILLEVQKTVPGDLLEARLKKRHGAVVYVLSILSKTGTYSVVTVSAKDKTIIKVQEK